MAVLKVTYQSEVRRCLLESTAPSFEEITSNVSRLFPEAKDCTTRYLDEEGDACTLCEASLGDFLAQARANGVDMAGSTGKVVLRLELVSLPKPLPLLAKAVPHVPLQEAADTATAPKAPPAPEDGESSQVPWNAPDAAWDPQGKGKGNGKGKWGKWGKGGGGKCRFGWQGNWHGHWHGHGHGEQSQQHEEEHPWWSWHGRHQWFQSEPVHSLAAALSPQAIASALVCTLPRLASKAREEAPEALGRPLCAALRFVPALGEALQELWSFLGRNSLQKAEQDLARFLAEVSPENGGQFLLSLVTELEALGFDEKLNFLATFFESQHDRLRNGLGRLEERLPFLPGLLVHQGVVCDGCGANPLLGPRFKCGSCPDYDLCGACYARRLEVHGGECAAHEFDCKLSEATHPLHMRLMNHAFKSKHCGPLAFVLGLLGQGGQCQKWGKCKGKGKRGVEEAGLTDDTSATRACASSGCGYRATWHQTHCCQTCARRPGSHGGRCDRSHNLTENPSEDVEHKAATCCATPGCQYQATKGEYCCGACAKGKRCGHGRRCEGIIFKSGMVASDSSEDSESKALDSKRCATPGCQYQPTWHDKYCCKVCAKGRGAHGSGCDKVIASESGSSEDVEHKAAKCCATTGCQYQATKGEYCCGACAKGKRCGHGKHCEGIIFKSEMIALDSSEDSESKALDGKPCATPGCQYKPTWHDKYCCKVCAKGRGAHGSRCDKVIVSESGSSEDVEPKAPTCCATPGCQYQATKGEYCCGACAKGKRCGHGKHCEGIIFVSKVETAQGNSSEDSAAVSKQPGTPEAPEAKAAGKPCAAEGCTYQVTWHETHCCHACAAHGPKAHGPHCEKVQQ